MKSDKYNHVVDSKCVHVHIDAKKGDIPSHYLTILPHIKRRNGRARPNSKGKSKSSRANPDDDQRPKVNLAFVSCPVFQRMNYSEIPKGMVNVLLK